MTNQISIYDHATGETIVRDMTADEQKAHDAEIAAYNAEKTAAELIATDKAAARQSVYDKLGLTTDDVAALFE